MKKTNIFLAAMKSLGSMAGVFVLGYMGYHYPDAMVWLIATAIFFTLFYYFRAKDNED